MGLGPPVCRNCKVIFTYEDKAKVWYCPSCATGDTNWFLFEQKDQDIYEQNTKFLKFLKGEPNGNS